MFKGMKSGCKKCIFFTMDECRRYPPQVTEIKLRTAGNPATQRKGWPKVSENHWCGEWQQEERK